MNINATLLAQAVVMIVFVAICWRYIYPPILSVMQEREKKISVFFGSSFFGQVMLVFSDFHFNTSLVKRRSAFFGQAIMVFSDFSFNTSRGKKICIFSF